MASFILLVIDKDFYFSGSVITIFYNLKCIKVIRIFANCVPSFTCKFSFYTEITQKYDLQQVDLVQFPYGLGKY